MLTIDDKASTVLLSIPPRLLSKFDPASATSLRTSVLITSKFNNCVNKSVNPLSKSLTSDPRSPTVCDNPPTNDDSVDVKNDGNDNIVDNRPDNKLDKLDVKLPTVDVSVDNVFDIVLAKPLVNPLDSTRLVKSDTCPVKLSRTLLIRFFNANLWKIKQINNQYYHPIHS